MSDKEQEVSGLRLGELAPASGSRKTRKRKGIGEGSGNGKTAGRGQKGQKSRAGSSIPVGFEGGQMPMHRRLPKFGFTSRKKIRGDNVFELLSVERLEKLELEGDISLDDLLKRKLLRSSRSKIKLLGKGKLSRKVSIEVHAASKSARNAVESAGGAVNIIGS